MTGTVRADHLRHRKNRHRKTHRKTWEPGESQSGDIVFQGKHAGGNLPSFYLMTSLSAPAFSARRS
ncbi:hypothetical protein ACWDPI_35800, partial [Streptomyces zhihengii]